MPVQRHIALLRGINVGTARRIAMADLRRWLTEAGFADVRTVLQSGNVVLDAGMGTDEVAPIVAAVIARNAGFAPAVIVRTAAELARIVAANPLASVATDPSRYLVGFLEGEPGPDVAGRLPTFAVADEVLTLIGREVYAWCPQGVLAASWAKTPWPRIVGTEVTARNWRTVVKLAELASSA